MEPLEGRAQRQPAIGDPEFANGVLMRAGALLHHGDRPAHASDASKYRSRITVSAR